jgi:ABC-type phosphate/phosphonate transport system substrate-binding protein
MKISISFCRMIAAVLLFWAGQAGAEPLEPLLMGFYLPAIRDANQADVKVSLGIWVEEIGKPYGVKITASTYDDMQSMRQALDTAELNFITAPGMELVEILKPDEVRQGYARRHAGIDEGLALIVSTTSNARKFADLRRKRVVRLDKDHLYNYFLEVQCLKASGLDCRDYLSLKEQRRDIQSVHDVFFGRVDAALVSLSTLRTAVELNPQVGDRIRVILDWKVKGLIFGMMTRHTQDRYRTLIVGSVQEAMKTPRAKQVLELFKTDYIEPVDADALEPFRRLLKDYQELTRSRAGRKK